MESNKIYCGNTLDVLKTFPDESINCCMTSPPYWALRDYGTDGVVWDGDVDCEHEFDLEESKNPADRGGKGEKDNGKYGDWEGTTNKHRKGFCNKCGAWKGQLGLEPDFNLYVKHLCDIFDEVKRVLRKDGTCWVNLGDTYGGNNSRGSNGGRAGFGNEREGIFSRFESKNLCNIPSRFSIEMQNRGWILRNKIIWHKPNCMPSSVTDRFTVDFEEIFFFVKNKKYWFEQQLVPYDAPMNRGGGESLKRDTSKTKEYKDIQKIGHSSAFRVGRTMRPNEQGKNMRTVWPTETKYEDLLQEKKMRQGMNRERGNNLVEKRDLPQQKDFVDYMRNSYNVDDVVKKTGLQRTKVEHWFRYDESGFSYPSKEDWEALCDETFPELTKVWYETDDVKSNVNGKNKRTVWKIPTQPFPDAHFAVFPEKLVETPIKAGCPKDICTKCGKPREKIIETKNNERTKKIGTGQDTDEGTKGRAGKMEIISETYTKCDCNAPFVPGIVLDPFMGSGTVALKALKENRRFVGIEINPKYIDMANERIRPLLSQSKLEGF